VHYGSISPVVELEEMVSYHDLVSKGKATLWNRTALVDAFPRLTYPFRK
jgi:hypothetical protein